MSQTDNILDVNGLTDTKLAGVCLGCGKVKELVHLSDLSGIHYCSERCRVKKECDVC